MTEHRSQLEAKCNPDPTETNSKNPTYFSMLKISVGFSVGQNHPLISEWQIVLVLHRLTFGEELSTEVIFLRKAMAKPISD